MNILFRDSSGNLHSHDIEEIKLNMKVDQAENGKYIIKLDRTRIIEGEFETKEDAEAQLVLFTNMKNELESN